MKRRRAGAALPSAVSVWLTRAWTAVVLGFVISEFCRFKPIPEHAPFAYLLILGWYAAWNGMKLWAHYERRRQPGEWIVYGWLALYALLFIIDWTSDRYAVTAKMVEVLLDVGLIFAGTIINKALYLRALQAERRKRHATRTPPGRLRA